MKYVWRSLMLFMAFTAITDSLIAIHEFQHIGDMHISWATDGIFAAAFFMMMAFREKSTE